MPSKPTSATRTDPDPKTPDRATRHKRRNSNISEAKSADPDLNSDSSSEEEGIPTVKTPAASKRRDQKKSPMRTDKTDPPPTQDTNHDPVDLSNATDTDSDSEPDSDSESDDKTPTQNNNTETRSANKHASTDKPASTVTTQPTAKDPKTLHISIK